MSREIKFRAYSKSRNRYLGKGDTLIYRNEVGLDGSRWWASLVERQDHADEDIIVEQYTGLKDKNGKEIYEGDIMEFGIAGAENRGVVGYEEDFGSYETYTSKGYIIAPLFTSRGKIIGNIHENPELLRGEEL